MDYVKVLTTGTLTRLASCIRNDDDTAGGDTTANVEPIYTAEASKQGKH